MTEGLQAGGLGGVRVSWPFACLGVCLIAGLALCGPAGAAPKPKASAKAPVVAGVPEPGWNLENGKTGPTLYYGLPGAKDALIGFACVPRSGDISIDVRQEAGRGKPDQSQAMSLTVGGVRSSFAGTVSEDPVNAGLLVSVTVPARSPMFTGLAGPGGMRIEGKGFTKIVPLRTIHEKLRQFLATCRKA
jgi:hypothetical protein